jgi:ABC-type polysaccharide/polyol phosphate transport system ATPase subunit
MASIEAREAGVHFLFDRQQRPVTPAQARFRRRGLQTWGLHGLSVSIGPGEGVALIGPSGAGKTTLLRLVADVMPVDEGRLAVVGRVGSLLSIDAGLLPNLTGRENAALLTVLAGLSRGEARTRLEEVKRRSRLGDAFERDTSSFSEGMRARLGFASVECARPEILVLDEVHEAVDHGFRRVLADHARALLDRGGIVMAAGHDHELLGRLCERALLLDAGRVAVDGPFERVRESYLGRAAAGAEG